MGVPGVSVVLVVVLPPALRVGVPGGGVDVPREDVRVGNPFSGQDLPGLPKGLLVGDGMEARDAGCSILR